MTLFQLVGIVWTQNIDQDDFDVECVRLRSAIIAKCYRYGRYISVKLLGGLGKKCERPHSFVKWGSFGKMLPNLNQFFW